MNRIRDEELVLYHYGDGLEPARRAEIADRLERDVKVSARLAQLRLVLDAAALDRPPEPGDALLARIADRVEARIAVDRMAPRSQQAVSTVSSIPGTQHSARHRRGARRRFAAAWAGGALAASLLLAVGYFAGRQSTSPPPLAPPSQPGALASAPVLAADRVYAANMAGHLDATRRALLTASNEDSQTLNAGNAELARALLDDHRLYLAVAAHRGDQRLATLLREIEPVLIELANPAAAGDISSRKGLVDFVDREDLIFQVRAAEAGLAARTPTRT